jgi:hypothetical protein
MKAEFFEMRDFVNMDTVTNIRHNINMIINCILKKDVSLSAKCIN